MNITKPSTFGLLAGIFLSAGLCAATVIATRAFLKVSENQCISVTGSARKDIRSDLAVWNIKFSATGKTLEEAAENSKNSLRAVEAFLQTASHCQTSLLPIEATNLYEQTELPNGDRKRTQIGVQITQKLIVTSTAPDLIPTFATDAAQLTKKGIMLETEDMKFIYTKAGEAKVEMMAEAAKDARARANQIATTGNSTIKSLRNARMGVVQITPRYSTATSWDGMNDTSSLEKTITTTVSATFSLE